MDHEYYRKMMYEIGKAMSQKIGQEMTQSLSENSIQHAIRTSVHPKRNTIISEEEIKSDLLIEIWEVMNENN